MLVLIKFSDQKCLTIKFSGPISFTKWLISKKLSFYRIEKLFWYLINLGWKYSCLYFDTKSHQSLLPKLNSFEHLQHMCQAFIHAIYTRHRVFLWNDNLFVGYAMKNITCNVAFLGNNRKGKLVTNFNWLKPLQENWVPR